ncbi:MAG: hypothetical protein AB7E47_17455 [Desulfovibrionaceae bacterium]
MRNLINNEHNLNYLPEITSKNKIELLRAWKGKTPLMAAKLMVNEFLLQFPGSAMLFHPLNDADVVKKPIGEYLVAKGKYLGRVGPKDQRHASMDFWPLHL